MRIRKVEGRYVALSLILEVLRRRILKIRKGHERKRLNYQDKGQRPRKEEDHNKEEKKRKRIFKRRKVGPCQYEYIVTYPRKILLGNILQKCTEVLNLNCRWIIHYQTILELWLGGVQTSIFTATRLWMGRIISFQIWLQ